MRRMTFKQIIRSAQSDTQREMREYQRDVRRKSLHDSEVADLRNLGLVHAFPPKLKNPALADALLRFRFRS